MQIVEVAPRDGLQNEDVVLGVGDKLRLVDALVATGVRRIEVTSFVSPAAVPALADADALCARLPGAPVSWIGLVFNDRGLQRALAAGVHEINVVVVASETFSRRNQNCSIEQAAARFRSLAQDARAAGLRVTLTVGAAFGCPFEGEVPSGRVAAIVADGAGYADEIALADTIGVGVPTQVQQLAGVAARHAPGLPLRWHFHNTRNSGYANALVAAELGAAALDASAGGIGGCPFAPAATGNIATEDLVYLLHRSGVPTGVDLDAAIRAAGVVGGLLGRTVPGQLSRAGNFPPD